LTSDRRRKSSSKAGKELWKPFEPSAFALIKTTMAEVEAANTAQAIADRLVQHSSAEEFPAGSAPEETAEAEDTLGAANNNKRPRDEDAEAEEDEQEQMRKRASFTAPEVAEVCANSCPLCADWFVMSYACSRTAGSETPGS